MEPLIKLALIYFTPIIVTIISFRKDPELSEMAPFMLIPFLNYLLAFAGIYDVIVRTFKSNGKCFLGHNFTLVYDSEAEKWKNGRMPMRVSMGGYEEFQCKSCDCKKVFPGKLSNWESFLDLS